MAGLAANFPTSPWSIEVSGLVNNPKTYTIEDLQKFKPEERIYRLRCVEAWSMVIPWIGFPLHRLLDDVQPTSEATYVKFTAIYDPKDMPLQGSNLLNWPYVEGLRMDEAMHDLTLMVTGMYGEAITQTGWSTHSLGGTVEIWFQRDQSDCQDRAGELSSLPPPGCWLHPNEYGFYANVNPNVDHPRWSQATERRIGEVGQDENTYCSMDMKKKWLHFIQGWI